MSKIFYYIPIIHTHVNGKINNTKNKYPICLLLYTVITVVTSTKKNLMLIDR